MEIEKITNLIEEFAPLELQEGWDCCGFQIDLKKKNINKILLCISATEQIINQAIEKNCDLIIAHHPLFFIPFSFNKGIQIYSAHTNLDRTAGGTTDTLISSLQLDCKLISDEHKPHQFVRGIELKDKALLDNFTKILKEKLGLESLRVVNNHNKQKIKRIVFCAGSGADFIEYAKQVDADVFVTGDVKYHTALDSDVIIIDVGHFESERPVLRTLEKLFKTLDIGVTIADEKSPFIIY